LFEEMAGAKKLRQCLLGFVFAADNYLDCTLFN